MTTQMATYLDAIVHLPDGATLTLAEVAWHEYVQHAQQIIGKAELDLTTDPPPDVVVEIDIHHGSTDKMPFSASLGVPEFWRYDERQLRIYRLEEPHYIEVSESAAFPGLTAKLLTRLLDQSKTQGQTAAVTTLGESMTR